MKLVKDILIIILIVLAILLVSAIFLYDYIPIGKVVPTVEPYVLSAEMEEELDKDSEFLESQVVTKYEINSKDLKSYEQNKKYKKGKENPFSLYEEETQTGNGGSKNNGGTQNNSSNSPSSNKGNSNIEEADDVLLPK